ncbi:MAG: ABC transporter ATP-binding protein [Clostridia bacterium]|nr:ABC transporter ATP-binding protein [Clostridia bacterium]
MRKQVSTVKTLMKYLGARKYWILVSLVLALGSVGLSLYIPVLTGQAVDLALGRGTVDMAGIGGILLKIGVCAGALALVQWMMSAVNNRLSFDTSRDIRLAAFRKIAKLPLKTIDAQPLGDIVSRVMSDVEQLSDGVLMGFTQLFTGVITILGTLIFMLVKQPLIAAAVVVVTPLSLVVSSFIAKRTYSMFKKQSENRGTLTAIIDESVSGMKTVKAFSQEETMRGRFRAANENLRASALKAIFFSSITNPATRFVNSVVYALVAVIGSLFAIARPLVMSVGDLQCFLSYASQYTKPFNEISGVVAEFQNALACAARVFEFIAEEEMTPDPANGASVEGLKGDVRIEDLSFSYEPDRKLIEHLNLSAPAGRRVAIVGPTGCGKTTLINLLMRFYEPDAGRITVDGVDAREYGREALRSAYGMVLQDTWLMSGTVRENIRFGAPNATDEQVVEAAQAAHAHSFIERLPDGYDTMLSEDGGGLSQGQKQLICIARVMLKTPRILILDEATSSIDTRTELRIQDAFQRLMEGRTSFVVAHRLSTIRSADVIVAMKDGKIMEVGSHEELLKKNGFYADLYMSQYR